MLLLKFTNGLSLTAFDELRVCTGENIRQERMWIDASDYVNLGTIGWTYNYMLMEHHIRMVLQQ